MNTNYLKQFEKYYNGEMEPEEKAAFEEALAASPEMNASYREYLSIYDALADKDMLDLRIKLKEIREESNRMSDRDFLSIRYNWVWVAALIVVILGISVVTSALIRDSDVKRQQAAERSLAELYAYSDLNAELMRYEQRDFNFKLQSPVDSIFISRHTPLNFQWTVDSTDPLLLELINWRGIIIFTSEKPVVSPYHVDRELPPGLLAYRFRTDSAAYCIGFLFLR